jgi:hypothetical protein
MPRGGTRCFKGGGQNFKKGKFMSKILILGGHFLKNPTF